LGSHSSSERVEQKTDEVLKTSKAQQTSVTDLQVPTSDKAAQTLVLEDPGVTDQNEFSMDNRISERIKRRAKLNPQSDYCDFIENVSSKKTTDVFAATVVNVLRRPTSDQKPEIIIIQDLLKSP
jgi:K+-transporting ATPase c subunit